MGPARRLVIVLVAVSAAAAVAACTQTPTGPYAPPSAGPSTQTTKTQTPSAESSTASPTTIVPTGTPSATSSPEGSATAPSKTEGVAIYIAGMTSAGPVPFTDGPTDVKAAPCMLCHGRKGQGGESGPEITWSELTSEGYDDGKFERAVTQGVDAEGKPLATRMPRYKLQTADVTSLLDYVKTF